MASCSEYYCDASGSNLPDNLPRMLFWRVLICPMQPRKVTKGGIILADESVDAQKHLNYIGKIVAVGESAFTSPKLGAGGKSPEKVPKVGDWVAYGRYAGMKVSSDGMDFLVVNDDEILCVVDDPSAFKVYAVA